MHLRPVPERPQRAVAYVRVSDEGGRGDDLISPDIQLTAIRDHCARRGYHLIETLEDIDLTGRLWKNRQIEQAVAMIEAGDADVIVVWKVSRVARNRKDWALAVDRVEGAGGQLESATEQLDTSTSTGRFTRGMLAELAAFESERIGETWREVHRQRTDRGLPHFGPTRFGYTYARDGYTVHPEEAPLVAELYRRYTAGAGYGQLTEWLRALGVVGSRGKPWTRFGVAYFMRSGFAAGYLYRHDPQCRCRRPTTCSRMVHVPGAHAPVITAEAWAAYRRVSEVRGKLAPRSKVPVSKLAGLVFCVGCGRSMQLTASNKVPRAAYFCRTNRQTGGTCPAPAWVRRDRCETLAREWLEEIAEHVDAFIGEAPTGPSAGVQRDRLARRVNHAQAALGKLAADFARGLIPEAAFIAARDELQADEAVAVAELRKLDGPDLSQMVGLASGLLAVWDTAEPWEVAAVARQLLTLQVERGGSIEVQGSWVGS